MKRTGNVLQLVLLTALLLTVACSKSDSPTSPPGNGGGSSTPELAGTWTVRSSGTGVTLRAIAASPTGFAIVGDSGIILTSSDGVTWSRSHSGTYLSDVVWTGTTFVAVGSGDGLGNPAAWAAAWSPTTTFTANFIGTNGERALSVTQISGGQLLACTSHYFLTSWDGVSWTVTQPGTSFPIALSRAFGTPFGTYVNASIYNRNYYNTYKMNGTYFDTTAHVSIYMAAKPVWTGTQLFTMGCQSSTDGITWVQRPPAPIGIGGLLWHDSLLVGVGVHGKVAWSPDGITWDSASTGVATTLVGVAYANGHYVAIGDGGVIVSRP